MPIITTRCTIFLRFFNSTCLHTRWVIRICRIAAAAEVVAAAALALIFASGSQRWMPAVMLPREAGAEADAVDAAAPVAVWSR